MSYEIQQETDIFSLDILTGIWRDSLSGLDEKRIKWSYIDNTDGKARVYILKDSDKQHYFGAGALIKKNFYIRGEEVNGGITADFAIKKEYRSLGPALKMQRLMTDSKDHELLIAFPNKQAELVQRRAGFQVLGNIVRYIKVFNSESILEKKFNKVIATLVSPCVNAFLKLNFIMHNKNTSKKYIVKHEMNEKFEEIWKEAKSRFDFIGNRSFQHLTWRYTQDPYKSYNVFSIEDKTTKESVAYMIYYMDKNIAYICDFLCRKSDLINDLFNTFISYCYNLKFNILCAVCGPYCVVMAYLTVSAIWRNSRHASLCATHSGEKSPVCVMFSTSLRRLLAASSTKSSSASAGS